MQADFGILQILNTGTDPTKEVSYQAHYEEVKKALLHVGLDYKVRCDTSIAFYTLLWYIMNALYVCMCIVLCTC